MAFNKHKRTFNATFRGRLEVFPVKTTHVQNIAQESARRARETKNEKGSDSEWYIVD